MSSFPVFFSGPELLEYLDWLEEHHPYFPRPTGRVFFPVPGSAPTVAFVFLCPSFPLYGPDGIFQRLYFPATGLFYPSFFPIEWEDRFEYWEWRLRSHAAHLCFVELTWRIYQKTRFATSACRQLDPPSDRDNEHKGPCIALTEEDWEPPRKKLRV
ncbi:hypothetical protein AMEX_G10244 [Astyanax mexicanus]|uniref:Uncharacterized protein n=1 Tax=Astyanax mexicanus TaxID=7994 RepID=A0A8T2LXP8_ASTMX|nr:hypothetical protein AMEX_G10244 [Astyanax mexicanus]